MSRLLAAIDYAAAGRRGETMLQLLAFVVLARAEGTSRRGSGRAGRRYAPPILVDSPLNGATGSSCSVELN